MAGGAASQNPAISGDGRYVAFDTENIYDVVDVNNDEDVFVRDRTLSVTVRVSVASNGAQGDGVSFLPSISNDGRFVAFVSTSTNLLGVGNDTNGIVDVFVHDRDTDSDGIFDEVGAISTTRMSNIADSAGLDWNGSQTS